MPVEVLNGVSDTVSYANGDLKSLNPSKKSRETERRRRRRKQKKNKQNADESDTAAEDANDTAGDDNSSKENSDPQKALELVEVEYVPEKAELDGVLDEEFRKVFEKFSFMGTAVSEEDDKKDESAPDAASKKKGDSDSEEEEQDTEQKEKGVSNKKKKLQRRMKIAELKQICTRPDVVEDSV